MSIICKLLGHKPPQSFGPHSGMGGGNYLELSHPKRDGIGRVHLYVYGNCPRCGERFQVGMMHLHQAEPYLHLGEPSHE